MLDLNYEDIIEDPIDPEPDPEPNPEPTLLLTRNLALLLTIHSKSHSPDSLATIAAAVAWDVAVHANMVIIDNRHATT